MAVTPSTFIRLPERVQQTIPLFLKVFDESAEVDSLTSKSAILRDFGLIQHFESIALEQFETAPAIEGHHLRVDPFDAVVVEMTEVSFQKLTTDLDGLGRRKQVDVEMPNAPGRCGNFTPSP